MSDKYFFLGKYIKDTTSIFLGGKIQSEPIPFDANRKRSLEGILNIDGNNKQVKGIALYEEMDDITSIILYEHPIKSDGTNTIYNIETEPMPDNSSLTDYQKTFKSKKFDIKGKYFGRIYNNVSIDLADEDTIADLTDIPLAEFIFGQLEFNDDDDWLPLEMDFEEYKKIA